jgi:hypothetical protein
MSVHWITKYALTDGIFELRGAEVTDSGYLSKTERDPWRHHFYSKKEYHISHEKAVARAEEMRVAKIASLKNQIVKFEKMTFGAKMFTSADGQSGDQRS